MDPEPLHYAAKQPSRDFDNKDGTVREALLSYIEENKLSMSMLSRSTTGEVSNGETRNLE